MKPASALLSLSLAGLKAELQGQRREPSRLLSREKQERSEEPAGGRLLMGRGQGYRRNVSVHDAQFKVPWLILGSGKDVIIAASCMYISMQENTPRPVGYRPLRGPFSDLLPEKQQGLGHAGTRPRFPNSFCIC